MELKVIHTGQYRAYGDTHSEISEGLENIEEISNYLNEQVSTDK